MRLIPQTQNFLYKKDIPENLIFFLISYLQDILNYHLYIVASP